MPFVNGVNMIAPGSSVNINDQNFQAPPSTGGYGMLLIGPATDGQPNTPISITPNSAKSILKGGDLLNGVMNAFRGAQKVGGSLNLTVIDPTPRTQATSTINNSSGAASIQLTTTSYGALANDAKWMVQAGATSGYTVSQGFDFVGPGGQTYPTNTQDNISLSALSLYYTGTATDVTATVTDTAFQVTSSGGVSIANIALASGMTVQSLVNQLNSISDLVSSVLDPNPQDAVASFFDNVTDVPLSTSSGSPTVFTANVTAVVRYFNNQNLYFTASRVSGATNLATSNTWVYASGGTTPTATNANWQSAYTIAQTVPQITFVAPVSPSYTLWAMNDAHCHYMASIGQPRRGYLGDASGQTLSTELQQVALLNSNRSTVVWPEQAGVDYNGNTTMFAPYLEACAVMGERAATIPYNALTQKPVPSNGMGQTVTPSMIAQALAGGLAIIAPNNQGIPVLQQDRTTWLQNTAYDKVENSTGLVADIVSADLNDTLSQFVGQPVTPVTVGQAQSAIFARLTYWYSQGFLSTAPKLSDISLTGSGDTITGTANAAFDVPANYIVLQLYPTAYGQSA
ncbi:hypothetical protein ACOJUR_12110 [Alicyclobacillus tolerans]|uniref:hypothetical protein n=1 Tax=Alicyclobacillus tolerans TaxID=90970 RepID=UPI003B75F65C